VQSRRLANPFEPLNSSLAQSAEELGRWQGNRKLLFFRLKSKYEYIIHRLSKYQLGIHNLYGKMWQNWLKHIFANNLKLIGTTQKITPILVSLNQKTCKNTEKSGLQSQPSFDNLTNVRHVKQGWCIKVGDHDLPWNCCYQ